MSDASDPPPFYNEIFGSLADDFLKTHYRINQSAITVENIKQIYGQLVDYFCT